MALARVACAGHLPACILTRLSGGRMLRTIREEKVAKVTLRLLHGADGYVGAILGGRPVPHLHGDDADQVWAKLRAEVGKASPHYFGYDGAQSRFLKLFPEGFAGEGFCTHERDYKVAAAGYLTSALPLETARTAGPERWEPAARAYSKTNLLSTFEQARTRDVLKGADGASFIAAAAALADGDHKAALPEIARLFRPHGAPSWPAATYLPFLWRPDRHMFLKPEVTRDYAQRVGHPFAQAYDASLAPSVYEELLALAAETRSHLEDLGARDLIDVQSFIWIVGAYPEAEAR